MTVKQQIDSRRRLLLFPLVLLSISCQLATLVFAPGPTPEIIISPTLALEASETSSPTLPSPTLTPSTTPSPAPTATPTLVVTPSAQQLSIFEQLWQTVKEEYLYPDFNGLDWDAIHSEYRQRVEGGLTPEEFYFSMNEMISRLGDEHSVFLSPADVKKAQAETAGNNDFVGIGVLIVAVPERNRAAIVVTFPGSPAEQAGLRSRDSILEVDGEPVLNQDGFLRNILRGPEGSQVTLRVETPGEQARQITLKRARVSGALPVPSEVLTSPAGQRVGYLLLVNFTDNSIDDQVEAALEAMSPDSPLDALILDNRLNPGGNSSVLGGMLSFFTGGTLGYFVSREEERELAIKPNDTHDSQEVPLVVLIGSNTFSFAEVFSGILQDQGRAFLIGEATEGNVETLWSYDFEDGSRAWLAHESFRPSNNPEENWELNGILPDRVVAGDWDKFVLEDDPVILAALEYFDER